MGEKDISSNDKENIDGKKRCDSMVIDSEVLSTCNSKCHALTGSTGPLIAKVPVILSDVEVEINVESEIELEKTDINVINIDKEVFVKECKLIPYTNKIFIEGYVEKNIQVSNNDCTNKASEGNKIEYTVVNSPFKCVTEIEFFRNPLYGESYKERLNGLDKNTLCKNNKEDSWIHYSKLYEPVYCECEYAKILEIDALDSKDNGMKCLDKKEGCKKILEKMVIFIRFKVIQNQQVFIPEFHGDVMAIESCNNNSIHKYTRNDDKDKSNVTVAFGENE
ncbi:CsxC family protein [Clostridium algidicarnis]|uniref:DUF7852 domain-containing protein n=1 Tax=Clostridium algidicarnis DSM 15099 TaxID=1121295 RepID=A0A2S6FVD1_9CLOT|nr:hypothetical protein [Clostridium algidicarnis]PPK45596.1 hypothetical protein BD821_11951 [Clostridium algidicarnis DSM 15099]